MRSFMVASAIALLGMTSTAHAGRYFQPTRVAPGIEQAQKNVDQAQKNLEQQRQSTERLRNERLSPRQRTERNQALNRQFRAQQSAPQTFRPYSSQAPAAGTKVTRMLPRSFVPLAARLGGSRGFARTSTGLFRGSRAGAGPVFGWKARTEIAWRAESGSTLFAFSRY